MQHSPLLNFIAKQNKTGLVEKDFLQQVTKQHPYFTPAQFYLLQQTEESDAAYNAQAARTAVLFNNPHWLHFQLQQTTVVDMAAEDSAIASSEITPLENAPQILSPEELLSVEDPYTDIVVTEEQLPAVEKTTPVENADNNAATVAETPPPLTEEQLMLAENEDINDDDIVMEEEIAPIKINIPNMGNQPIKENILAFEPMHLVDYFASQGIKLSDEVQTADKLGKQLKSFTEWLKTMKKIHVPATETSTGNADITVQTMAEKSNAEDEVLTEAMAEVLAQQGKAGKAIELYQKLSLLNPSKSAFFAAKIEQLKGS